MKSIVVTGVSSGIGRGITRVLVENGFHVFGSVRNATDATQLQAEFAEGFTPLVFDVTDEAAVVRAAAAVEQALGGKSLAGLVNNAGISFTGPLLYQPLEEFRKQIEVNLIGAFIVTKAFAPLLRNQAPLLRDQAPLLRDQAPQNAGRIVNISSVGGKIGPPFLGAYAASKHGLEGMSESLRRELQIFGIQVIVIGPGSVVTPIWDKAEAADATRYANTVYAEPLNKFTVFMLEGGRKGLAPERVGEVVLTALTVPRPRLRYEAIPDKLKNWTLPNLLPRRWLDRIIGSQLGLRPAPKPLLTR